MSLRPNSSHKRLRRAAVAGLAVALSLTLSGCGLFGIGATPQAPNTVHLNGSVLANPMPLQIPEGGYRTITPSGLDDASDYDKFDRQMMASEGYSTEAGFAGLKSAKTFMAEQFIDSTALEGDMSAFQAWYDTTGAKLIDPRAAANATDASEFFLVLGNYGKKGSVFPAMVHDRQPRVSSAALSLVQAGPYFVEDGSKLPGISYLIGFEADYRATDAGLLRLPAASPA